MRHSFNNGRVIVERIKRRSLASKPVRVEQRREIAATEQVPGPAALPTLHMFPRPGISIAPRATAYIRTDRF